MYVQKYQKKDYQPANQAEIGGPHFRKKICIYASSVILGLFSKCLFLPILILFFKSFTLITWETFTQFEAYEF